MQLYNLGGDKMYNRVESEFKKESIYNKMSKFLFKRYMIVVILVFIVKIIFKMSFFIEMFFTIILFFLETIIELKISKDINILKKDERINYAKRAYEEELILLKNILKENDLYNEKMIKDLIEHYRNLIPSKKNEINVPELISIIFTIVLGIYSIIKEDEKTITIIIAVIIVMLFIIYVYNQIRNIIVMLKGEEDINERLEGLLGEIYSEVVNTTTNNNVKIKKKRKK